MANDTGIFAATHIGSSPEQQATMLAALGLTSTDELVEMSLIERIRLTEPLDLPPAIDEATHLGRMRDLAALNNPLRAMIGLGYHGTVTPAVIRRNVLEDPTWYTAYTPYQPEISQGRLEALINFQTLVQDLTGLPISGASLLDEGTAAAEAMRLARRQTRKGDAIVVDQRVLPRTLAVLRTHAHAMNVEVVVAGDDIIETLQQTEAFAVLVQTPGADGRLQPTAELAAIAAKAHENGALVIAAADLLALTLVTPPGEWGADVAVGSTQRFGVPLFYGGPHAGYIALSKGLERSLPGRLVGVSQDADGHVAYRLALQTREQHIRREKATSNICTAQVLLAVVASCYAVYHGPDGLRRIARGIHDRARALAGMVSAGGLTLAHDHFFDTITVQTTDAAAVVATARELGVHLRRVDDTSVGVSVGEDTTDDDIARVAKAFGVPDGDAEPTGSLGADERTSDFCTHPVFNSYHSETEMMRYLRRLSDYDFALDKGMIPLGSCTMKLNSAAELEPISLPGFANLHPFVPEEDAQGYAQLISDLCDWLAEITGYDRVTVQPNAGSQGEYAGLLAIRAYHDANGDTERRVCLIPASAHGTNAASAAMAGLRVVVVKTAPDGTVDFDDLRAKVEQHRDELAAIMVTYPSTHGVFEEGIVELCDLVHSAGGQVYVDGANMNAMVGIAKPRNFGADVSHLNLHKTFAIPHGGGGPGVGPIGVREHLAPFIDAAVSSAPYGSPGVLPISYGYIALMGPDGLREATKAALLHANYIAARLKDHYPVLYTGPGGRVAHECILDLRALTKKSGVTVEDVAKRLIDYGFHAPTLSFPVSGTLMVEPTESESLAELDRFCDAMISIRSEIDQVAAGQWPADDNPLHNAPHPLHRIVASTWTHPYSRELAGFGTEQPTSTQVRDKFWPAVGRLDGAYGDRNLLCSCPPPEAFA